MKTCVQCQKEKPDHQVSLGLCDECFNAPDDAAVQKAVPKVILTTSFDVPGREISEVLGIVSTEAALAQGLFKDIGNSWRDFLGGRSNTVQKAIREVREACLDQLKREAAQKGADAVIAVQLSYSDMQTSNNGMGGILFLSVSGTAVRMKPQNS